MSQLSDMYEKETGKQCCGLMCHVLAPTSEYANWLEIKVEKLTAHNKQSTPLDYSRHELYQGECIHCHKQAVSH